jgi:hypothetical protein
MASTQLAMRKRRVARVLAGPFVDSSVLIVLEPEGALST